MYLRIIYVSIVIHPIQQINEKNIRLLSNR